MEEKDIDGREINEIDMYCVIKKRKCRGAKTKPTSDCTRSFA